MYALDKVSAKLINVIEIINKQINQIKCNIKCK